MSIFVCVCSFWAVVGGEGIPGTQSGGPVPL